jgi:hypothetical protein
MSKNAKTSLLLVLCLLLTLVVPNSSASSITDEVQILSFDQEDGLHVQSMLNLSGDSTVALSSIEIELWNISSPDQWTPMLSSPYLDSVVPYSLPESGMTMWSWNHSFNLTGIDCTCYVEISLLEQTDLTSFGLVVYAGQDNHRPVLRPSSSSGEDPLTTTQIFSEGMIDISFGYILPPSPEFIVESDVNILPEVRYCSAPYGICVDEYSTITTTYSIDNELNLLIDVDGNQLDDGFYLLQIQIQDSYLSLSNNVTQYVIIDQTKPLVELSAVEQVVESDLVVVDVNASDGYIGSRFVITWTIIEPGNSPRSVSDRELLQDNRLELEAKKSGTYTVRALVRDLGGNLVIVEHNVSVTNQQPTAVVRYDGFQVFNGSIVTIPNNGNWVFSANDSSDTMHDQESLEYYWYVDGKSLLSGKSYLESSDVEDVAYRTIYVEVVDDDGSMDVIRFEVIQQQEESKESLADVPVYSVLTLLVVLVFGILYVLRSRSQSDGNTGFVKWTERGKAPKN